MSIRSREIRHFHTLQRGVCASCGKRVPDPSDLALLQDRASIDHVTPRALGGSDDICNKVMMHRQCNSDKGDRSPTGCELIWHHFVLGVLELHPMDLPAPDERGSNSAMADALRAAGLIAAS